MENPRKEQQLHVIHVRRGVKCHLNLVLINLYIVLIVIRKVLNLMVLVKIIVKGWRESTRSLTRS